MTAFDEEVAAAVHKAQVAQLTLTGLMVAHKISRQELKILLAWPAPVTAAFAELDAALRPLSKLLAEQDGKVWEGLALAELVAYTRQAHGMVMDAPISNVPHASGVGPIGLDSR